MGVVSSSFSSRPSHRSKLGPVIPREALDIVKRVDANVEFAADPATRPDTLYENGRELQAGLIRYFDFYTRRRIHQSHEYRTPDEVYYAADASEPLAVAAWFLLALSAGQSRLPQKLRNRDSDEFEYAFV